MGIVGPQIYQPKFGPTYRVSFSTSIGLLSCTVISVAVTWWFVVRGDKQRALVDEPAEVVDKTEPCSGGSDADVDGSVGAVRKEVTVNEKI